MIFTAFSVLVLAESITGTVINKTTNKPAVGDDVVLIRLAQGMQETTRTTTDSKGHFTLDVPDAGMHLVRVTHDKATYFRPAPPGTQSVEIEVYNAAAKVSGVTGEADVMRIQTDESGKNLNVVEHFFIKNDSNPPMTQFSPKSFEFYLPAGAIIAGSAALAPGSMPVKASPVPLGDPNHYAFVFPLRPGETQFQVSYSLPYTGSFKFAPRLTLPTDTVAVMLPKSMSFTAGGSASYAPVTEETTAQAYVARNASPSEPLDFTLSGSGQLPRDTQAAATSGDAGQAGASADNRPGGGLGNPIDPSGNDDPWAKYKWWILGALGLAMAAGAGIMLKNGPAKPAYAGAPSAPLTGPGASLAALKEELFALESEKLQGRISEAEYAEQKAALEVVLRRALSRSEANGDASKIDGPVV
ncbi:MAG TPA: carboxypeptidase regulatory-like domain-containing protein [Edaphobacter sp.]|nr:carboxypeptidase regulatory-like domain-containing protein [Edaphobacter sp.]